MDAKHFPAKKAAYLAGFRTTQMLDYLERSGLFLREEAQAEGANDRVRGRRRKYTFRDVVVLRSINQLLEKGISVERIRKAVTKLWEDPKFGCDRSSLRYNEQVFQYLITDGQQVFFRRTCEEITSLLENGQMAFLFVVDIENARQHVLTSEVPRRKRGSGRT